MAAVPARTQARKTALMALKWMWLITVIAFAVWYVRDHRTELAGYWNTLGFRSVVAAVAILGIGRFFLSEVSRHALRASGLTISPIDSLAVNSVSQLGKYIPGSVWHLVGRVGLYRRWGASTKQASGVLVIENGILLLSGAGLALIPVAILVNPLGDMPRNNPLGNTVLLLASLCVVAGTLAGARLLFRPRFPVIGKTSLRLTWSLSVLFWAAFGVAFWLCVGSGARDVALLPIAIGVFAAGWIAGNLAPFAPAGVGVREAVIVALLGPFVGTTTAIGAAAASRAIWTINELLLALPSAAYISKQNPDPLRSHGGTNQ